MSDDAFILAFSTNKILVAAHRFGEISNGFSPKQREWCAIAYFQGCAEGARSAGDTNLERVYRDWITGKLRPLGFDVAAAEIGIGKGKACVGKSGTNGRSDGAGQGATGG